MKKLMMLTIFSIMSLSLQAQELVGNMKVFVIDNVNGQEVREEAKTVENGDIIRIAPSNAPQIIDKAPSGRMYLDGSIGVREDSNSIKERKNISINGYLEVTVLIGNNGKIKKPIIPFKGIPTEEISETFVFDMEDEIDNICRTFSVQSKNQEKNLIDTLKQNCKKIVKDRTGKKPYTTINISRL